MYNLQFYNLDTISLEQRIDSRFTSAETAVEVSGFLRAATLKNMLAEEFGRLLVEDRAVLCFSSFEYRERIGIQQFAPFVSIVSCCVASGEDVRKCRLHLCARHVRQHLNLCHCLVTEADHSLLCTQVSRHAERLLQ